jgi:signal transduction histidine kinase/AmiR/NasT family two-component response regulator/HPt (histidine-containing phosphotransfer) domain-containing protein
LQVLIVAVAAGLIALTLQFTESSVTSQAREAQARAESDVANIALGVEWQLNRQLQSLDQLMALLVSQWQSNPVGFDPTAWARKSSVLGDGSLQVLVLNAKGVVTAASDPVSLGLDMSGQRSFRSQRDSPAAGLFVGPAIGWGDLGRWEINLSRRLDTASGQFAGALVVAYDPWALATQLQQIDLGPRGLIALVGDNGSVRTLVAPFDLPPGTRISGTPMFRAMTDDAQGLWTGPSAPDGVVRVHAFRRLRDQDLTIVIGIDRAVAMLDADTWQLTAWSFAAIIAAALAGIAVLLLLGLAATRRREAAMAEDSARLQAAYADAELAKSQAEARTSQLEGLLGGMSDGVLLLDHHLQLALWNARFCELTGLADAQLSVGMPIADVLRLRAASGGLGAAGSMTPAQIEAEVERRVALLRDLKNHHYEQQDTPTGSLELRRTALPGGGIITLFTDITARRQAEQAREEARRIAHEVTEQKASFVAVVSHEIRTPLNAVLGSLSLLDRSGLSPSQRRLAASAHQAGDALLDLVNDILDLSRVEAGKLELRSAPFDVIELIEGVVDMFATEASGRNMRLRGASAPDLPRRLVGDAGRLRQIVMNFLGNAIKFSDPGPITVAASAGALEGGAPALVITVSDPGPAIGDADGALLFRPFSRLASARSAAKPGTGLGLAICDRLARLMGGRVGLRRSEAGGNAFWIAVPLEAAPLTAPVHAADRIGRTRRLTVLVVEDIPVNQMVTAMALRRAGHRVEVAESGAEAIALVQQVPFDVVLMDLSMPGMGGEEAALRIRGLPGAAGRMPILALTATTAPEDRARCEAAGMNGMLSKPVPTAVLLETLDALLVQHTAPAAVAAGVAAAVAVAVAVAAPDIEPAADETLLDGARLAELRDGLDPATAQRLFGECLDDFRARLPSLRAAVAAADIDAAAAQAHTLAGMAATYGLAALERRMRRIMAAAQQGDLAPAAGEAVAAGAELERVAARVSVAFGPIAA